MTTAELFSRRLRSYARCKIKNSPRTGNATGPKLSEGSSVTLLGGTGVAIGIVAAVAIGVGVSVGTPNRVAVTGLKPTHTYQ